MVVICCVYLGIELGEFLIKTLMKVKTDIDYCLEIFYMLPAFLKKLVECV